MYGKDFYSMVSDGAHASALALVPQLVSEFDPRTVVDIGCGQGWWARAFHELGGCVVLGVDGSPEAGKALAGSQFQQVELTDQRWYGRHDLAVCLEVGEHLPDWAADGLVKTVCASAPTVVWSAAIPGQGGAGHINEQPPGYWVEKFRSVGYAVSGALRLRIWDDARIEPWYRQNLLIASMEPERYPTVFEGPAAEPLHLVHPILLNSWRTR